MGSSVHTDRDENPAGAVPSCPDWTPAGLARHVGTLQRRFGTLLSQRVQEPPRGRDVELGLPDDPREYAGWVAAVLRDTDPDAAMWAWGRTSTRGSGPAGCSARRWSNGWTPSAPSAGSRASTPDCRRTVWTSSSSTCPARGSSPPV
ncbi:maleylpyruvate isomerase N-terminal domain-containing protein [Streptomyces flaveolus]|uniref:maleylpyruvate isomerase N-terminal domain-containing protein n=1 Tax=Streptomyces flaveolus TaxID=67297 RepID=UPI0033A58A24